MRRDGNRPSCAGLQMGRCLLRRADCESSVYCDVSPDLLPVDFLGLFRVSDAHCLAVDYEASVLYGNLGCGHAV